MYRAAAALLIAALGGCGDRGQLPLEPGKGRDARSNLGVDRLEPLIEWEQETRASTDFAALPPFEQRSGSNPHRVAALRGERFVALLRGSSELLILSAEGAELGRLPAPASPVDLAIAGDQLLVVGERSDRIARYRIGAELEPAGEIAVPGAVSLRAIAAAPGGPLVVADQATGQVLELSSEPREIDRCHGPLQLALTARHLVLDCLLDHELRVFSLGAGGPERVATIRHKGPIWRFAAAERAGELVIAATGVEDRELDRSVEGSFGYIDSFAFVYAVRGQTAERRAEINLGELGLVTPKWIELELGEGALVRATSYGGDRMVELRWSGELTGQPEVSGRDIAPGTTDLARAGDTWIAANPLFDQLLVGGPSGSMRPVPVAPADPRSLESRVGELLFFTKLMSPWAQSTGRKSRFSCEACHFEGFVDGRTHYTGRDDVHATSRSLRGLFNNRPHFSRALDGTTAGMVDNEFKVANKLTGRDHWFALGNGELPWLTHLRAELPATMSPAYLRRALMLFLRDFTNRPNPFARGREGYSELERRGAALFRDRCERCHAARLVTDEAESRVDFPEWERHIFSPTSGIVWASEGYQRTGVTPYVHELGARTPSLRRLYRKWPYFTDGSARSLTEVLEAVRFSGETLVHRGLERGEKLSPDQIEALERFLLLL